MEYTVVVALRPDRKFMMIKHKKRGWEWPGGKLHAGESPIECARREILEETGYELIRPKVVMETGNGEGGKGYVIFAHLGKKICEISDPMTEKVDFFGKLPEAKELSFPHDPYDEVLAIVKDAISGLRKKF